MANTSWGNSESYLESQMEGVVEVSKSYKGGTTEDIAVNVNDATDTITANLTEQSKKSIGSKVGLNVDNSTYIMTLQLLNKDGELLSEGTVDLPLESMIIGATYSNGIIKLNLKNGETLDVSISDLISGLVPDSRTINGKPLSSDITLTADDIGASIPDNMVTTDTEQTITGKKIVDSQLTFGLNGKLYGTRQNGQQVQILSYVDSSYKLYLGNPYSSINVTGAFLPYADASGSLGNSLQRWGSFYLSGELSDGTNSITIADLIALKNAGSSTPTNMVTTDTTQDITARKTFKDNIVIDDGYGYGTLYMGPAAVLFANGFNTTIGNQNGTCNFVSSSVPSYNNSPLALLSDVEAIATQIGNIDTLLTALNSGEGV